MRLLLTIWFLSNSTLIISQPYGFENISESAGVKHFGKNYGVAIGDFDNDGDEDIYVSKTGNEANLLYVNMGNFKFEEKAQSAGIAYSGTTYHSIWGDIDNDGDLDLYLGNKNEPNVLYLNQGDGTFMDISRSAGIDNDGGAVSAIFGDVNNDGLIDIYVANINAQNVLYKNNGDLTFTDITKESGATDELIAMGTMFIDFDNDNDLDLYLSHDALQANILYQNDGFGHFTDVSQQSGVDYEGFGMGTEFADFNNDGYYDIYITNLYDNTLYMNNKDGSYSDVSASAGVNDYGMGWGVSCLDYNNDGLQDIYAVNNSYFSPYANILYENMGNGQFSDASSGTSLESNYAGYGVGCADFDGDGWVDLFVANSGATGGNQLFRNKGGMDHWITFKLKGTISNTSAIGAKITINSGDMVLMDQVAGGAGYASQNSMILHFGLKNKEKAEKVIITWPGGIEETYVDLISDQHYLVTENEGLEVIEQSNKKITSLDQTEFSELLSVFPNPAQGFINLRFNQEVLITAVHLIDLSGRTIQSTNYQIPLSTSEEQIELPVNINKGTYMLKMETSNGTIVKRIEVMK